MKVLIISSLYPSVAKKISGIFVHNQVKELIKYGCNIIVVSPIPYVPFPLNKIKNIWSNYGKIPNKRNLEGIKVYYPRYISFPGMHLFEFSGYFMYWGIRKIIKKIFKEFKFDLFHAHSALPDGFVAMKLSSKYKKPFMVTIHGMDLQNTIFKNTKCKYNIIKVIKEANVIVTVSNKLKKIIPNKLGVYRNIFVINNGINQEKIFMEKNYKKDLKYSNNKYILSVSGLFKSKGLDVNIKALSILHKNYPNLKYIIIGDGPEAENLKKLSMSLNLDNDIKFLGELPNKKVMKYMAFADIFSLPSWEEGFGIVYLEAMAHEKPVIGCKGEGIEDVIKHKINGFLVKPKDILSLVEIISYIIENPKETKKISRHAKESVLKNYTWSKNAKLNIKIYQEIITENTKRRGKCFL